MPFYVLEEPKARESDAIIDFYKVKGSKTGSAPKCPACGAFTGMLPLLPPLRFELETWGSRFGDLGFRGSGDLLVSERFKDEFLKSGLIGFPEFVPAEITKVVSRRRINKPAPRYFLARPVQSRTAVDTRASGIDYGRPWTCPECRSGLIKRLRRLVLEPGTWSGEDVFVARGLPGTTITSQRFKEFCDRHAFSNCVLIPADQYHFDFYPWESAARSPAPDRH